MHTPILDELSKLIEIQHFFNSSNKFSFICPDEYAQPRPCGDNWFTKKKYSAKGSLVLEERRKKDQPVRYLVKVDLFIDQYNETTRNLLKHVRETLGNPPVKLLDFMKGGYPATNPWKAYELDMTDSLWLPIWQQLEQELKHNHNHIELENFKANIKQDIMSLVEGHDITKLEAAQAIYEFAQNFLAQSQKQNN